MHNFWFEVKRKTTNQPFTSIEKKKVFLRPVPHTQGKELTISKTYLNTPVVIGAKRYSSICDVCVNRYHCWNKKKSNPKQCLNWMATSVCRGCTHHGACYKMSKSRCDQMSSVAYPGYSGFVLDRGIHLRFDPNPTLKTSFDLAMKIGVKNRVLTWLLRKLYDKDLDLYHSWTIAKNNGGQRTITAPRKELKAVQRHILDRILGPSEIRYHDRAFGFIPTRNIVMNAGQHTNKNVVVSLDLQDFFPSIRFPRVYGVLKSMGFDDRVAGVITALCTWDDALPQGAPTSPVLSNLVAYRLDKKLTTYTMARGWTYTRYADDLTFSSDEKRAADHLITVVRKIIQEEGFKLNENKIKIMRSHKRQWVTGLVANGDECRGPNVIRWKYRQLRAAVHNAMALGIVEASKKQQISPGRYRRWVEGNLAFHYMVNASRMEGLSRQWEKVQ